MESQVDRRIGISGVMGWPWIQENEKTKGHLGKRNPPDSWMAKIITDSGSDGKLNSTTWNKEEAGR